MSIFPAGILLSGLVPSAGDRGQADVRLAPHRGYGVHALHEKTLGKDCVVPIFIYLQKMEKKISRIPILILKSTM